MLRIFALPLLALLAFSQPALTQVIKDNVVDRVQRSTGSIIDNQGGHGSAFVVLPNVVATNAHVVGFSKIKDLKLQFTNSNGLVEKHAISLLYIDRSRDLAMFQVEGTLKDREPLKLASAVEPKNRPAVFVFGNPAQGGGDSIINALGRATMMPDLKKIEGETFYEMQLIQKADLIKIGPGNSGGPIVNIDGEVVGVLTRGTLDAGTPPPKGKAKGPKLAEGELNSRAYGIPVAALKEAMDSLGDQEPQRKAAAVKANERHALAMAARSLSATNSIAELFFKSRLEMWKNARAGIFFNGKVVEDDADLIRQFNECYTDLKKQTDAYYRTASISKTIAAEDRKALVAQYDMLELTKSTIVKKRFSQQEYDKTMEKLSDGFKQAAKLSKSCNIPTKDVLELMNASLSSAGITLKVKD